VELEEALRELSLSADALQCMCDQEDPDVIAVRLSIDDAESALAGASGMAAVELNQEVDWDA